MRQKRHTPEEIISKLRQVDVLVAQGTPVADAIRSIGVTEVTYYRWRQEYGGLKSYHPSDFHVAQSGGGAMRRCRQKGRRRRPRVNRDIRLRATFLGCVPAVFFQQGCGSRRHPTCRLTPPNEGPAPAPERAGPAGRCA